MRILLINVTYGKGSTGKIVESLYNQFLAQKHDVYCIYGRKSSVNDNKKIIKSAYEFESKFWHALSRFSGNLYGGMPLSTIRIKRLIKRIKPDVVHLHCLNGYFVNVYSLIKFLKRIEIKTILTNHADFMFTANCGYALECINWANKQCKHCKRIKDFNGKLSLNRTHHYFKKMLKSFTNFKNLYITNVSPWLTKRSLLSPIFENKTNISTVLNPVQHISHKSLMHNPYLKYVIDKNKKIILYVTPNINNPEKGGINILKLADLCKKDNYQFFVKSLTKPNFMIRDNITLIESNDASIFSFYHYADCTLMLSKRETFSMVVAESLCSGTPVVGFKAGGPESIAIDDYCSFVDYGDIKHLKSELDRMLQKKLQKDELLRLATKKYSQETIASEYLSIYKTN